MSAAEKQKLENEAAKAWRLANHWKEVADNWESAFKEQERAFKLSQEIVETLKQQLKDEQEDNRLKANAIIEYKAHFNAKKNQFN